MLLAGLGSASLLAGVALRRDRRRQASAAAIAAVACLCAVALAGLASPGWRRPGWLLPLDLLSVAPEWAQLLAGAVVGGAVFGAVVGGQHRPGTSTLAAGLFGAAALPGQVAAAARGDPSPLDLQPAVLLVAAAALDAWYAAAGRPQRLADVPVGGLVFASAYLLVGVNAAIALGAAVPSPGELAFLDLAASVGTVAAHTVCAAAASRGRRAWW